MSDLAKSLALAATTEVSPVFGRMSAVRSVGEMRQRADDLETAGIDAYQRRRRFMAVVAEAVRRAEALERLENSLRRHR